MWVRKNKNEPWHIAIEVPLAYGLPCGDGHQFMYWRYWETSLNRPIAGRCRHCVAMERRGELR